MTVVAFLLALSGVAGLSFLVGFGIGHVSSRSQAHRTQMQAAKARRELHALTRSAFVRH